jgi:hypothetical protein
MTISGELVWLAAFCSSGIWFASGDVVDPPWSSALLHDRCTRTAPEPAGPRQQSSSR